MSLKELVDVRDNVASAFSGTLSECSFFLGS